MIKINRYTLSIAILVLTLILLLLIGRYQLNQRDSDIRKFETLVKVQNQEIERTKTEVITTQKAIKTLSEQAFLKDRMIKEVLALVQSINKTIVVKVPLKYENVDTFEFRDTVYITKENRDSFIRVPVKASFNNKDLYVGVTVKKTGVTLDSLILNDTVSFRIVKRKKGLFKAEYVLETVRSSPYVKTTSQSSYIFKPKVTMWNKIIKPTIFFILGMAIIKL